MTLSEQSSSKLPKQAMPVQRDLPSIAPSNEQGIDASGNKGSGLWQVLKSLKPLY
jgi:hypothetical protein